MAPIADIVEAVTNQIFARQQITTTQGYTSGNGNVSVSQTALYWAIGSLYVRNFLFICVCIRKLDT